MADNDYICDYRQFFEEFAKTSQMEDCRPMRIISYDLSIDELVGEVMQSCVNYLIERKCPRSLVVPLTKIVIEEFINEAKKQPEIVYTPLKLDKETHDKISEVCLRYIDNEKLSSLPGPVQETCYSTHSTKHTRRRMEDRLICLPRFNALHNIQSNSEAGYYGIFDGHGGVHAACYAVSHLHQFLAESRYYPDDPVEAFCDAFRKTEFKFNSKGENNGTTVLAILHQPVEKKLTVAWVGDSQAMLVNENSYVMLINPHKPERIDERKRIEALGGCVIRAQSVCRVNGGLAVSRAIGDKELKPYISAEPEIRVVSLTGNEHFIVMGCDGLWDVVEPQQVIETVYFEVKKNEGQVDSVARRLVDLAKENNSTDNISVIVIFLTDPAEISNRSVDVTGHRPKILQQDGVIMDANFQTNDKSPFSDPGMNGIYEPNGNHFNNHMQNESDEDLGPETDVDAVDDILTSKNLNPFAKDCWQKTTEENSDILIELPENLGNEIIKFAEDFTESPKPVEDTHSSQISSSDIKSDKFSMDSMNPFETSVTNKASEESNILNNFADDNNKYFEEINSRKEETEDFMPSNTVDQSFDMKQVADLLGKPQEINPNQDFFNFDSDGVTETRRTDSCAIPQDSNTFFNEGSKSNVEEDIEKVALESPVQKESASEFGREFDMKDISSNENNGSQSSEINTTLNKMDEFRELTFKTNEEAVDLIPEDVPLDASGNPPELCSVIDVVEAEKASCDFSSMEKSVTSKGDEPSSELLSPSAPALEGELKDDAVVESGGEVEDSEDDEWNYIKVESGVHQTVPVDNETSDLVPSFTEQSEVEKATMNSPLNPEADEFIPVSAMSSADEYNTNMTPKKAIPDDLTDIIASSPNWNNMNNVSLPEESTFLNEIKSRPSNIFDNIESPQQEDSNEKANDINTSLSFMSPEQNKENEFVTLSQGELHGLDLASDMTSSFIDPSTMSPEIEIVKEQPELMNSQIKEFDTENKELFLDERIAEIEEPANVEVPPKLPDVSSSAVVEEVTVPSTVDEIKLCSTEVPSPVPESVSLDISQPPVSELEERKFSEENQASTPSNDDELIKKSPTLSETLEKSPALSETLEKSPALSETFEKSPVEEKANETTSPKSPEVAESIGVAAAATAAVVGAATTIGIIDAKKDSKKPAPKATSTSVSKTPNTSKPLLNGTKGSATAKKSTPSTQPSKTSFPGKTTATTTVTATKTSAPKTTSTSKPLSKTTASVSSALSKAPARPRPTSAAAAVSKSSPTPKTTVTISPTKSTTVTAATTTTLKSTTKTPGSAASSTTLKSKPRVSSATFEKKTTSSVNGETKSTIKRTEVITKKTSSGSNATTTTTTITATTGATRASLSARTTTGPPKPAALKTTVTTTRTVTAKPRTTLSSNTTSGTLTSASKPSPMTRKSIVGADKQAKEVANRLTSKATSVLKANGVAQRNTTTTMAKTRKSLTSTATTPTKTKNHDKTENKAEKILEKNVEIIQSENGAPLIENINNTGINLIDNIISE